jgi:hypothetical protein
LRIFPQVVSDICRSSRIRLSYINSKYAIIQTAYKLSIS